METEAQIAERWRYLRQVLNEQLAHFESGSLKLHSGGDNVSAGVIARLKREIEDFDRLIRRSENRSAGETP
jgi:hypothetical protein